MNPIYITGHRNPDTDSIVSAIAYAELKHALGERNVQAVRLGEINNETGLVLKRFGFAPPPRLNTVKTQIRDLAYDQPSILSRAVTVQKAWDIIRNSQQQGALPIIDETGKLVGIVTKGSIAEHNINTSSSSKMEPTSVFNLLSTLEGQLVNEGDGLAPIQGEIIIAIPSVRPFEKRITKGCIVICGDQEDIIRLAIVAEATCIIVCEAEVPAEFKGIDSPTRIISTPCDIYKAINLIPQSIPVERICGVANLVSFHLDSYVDDAREIMLQSRHSSYPVLDENDRAVGTVSRYHLIRPNRKRIILVDHNEFAQSAPGLEQAEILEIIDHHRLADVQTAGPIFVRNEPVGSTSTIIANMFLENGIFPGENLAGLIVAAILSDTVLFKSPTCTDLDRRMAQRMARLADVDIEKLGKEIFSAATTLNEDPESLLFTDFKEFRLVEHNVGIGQVSCLNSKELLQKFKEPLMKIMENTAKQRGFDMVILMFTDVLREGSELLFYGEADVLARAFGMEVKESNLFLPGVISRKKQVVPMLSAVWG